MNQEVDCERCRISEESEKPESSRPPRNSNGDTTVSDDNNPNAHADSPNEAIGRSQTNRLEQGQLRSNQQEAHGHSGLSITRFLRQALPWTSTSKSSETPKYTLSQAYFIVAGGLAVETKSFRSEPYLTVTPAGAIELARLDFLDPIPEDVIDDKNKADLITKALVCIQAGWFIIQCVSRIAQELPLSLLEVHVLAHVFVAFMMYCLWFAKPYDVLSPVVIKEASVIEIGALFTVHKEGTYQNPRPLQCFLRDNWDKEKVVEACFANCQEALEAESPSNAHSDQASTQIASHLDTYRQHAMVTSSLALRAIDTLKSHQSHFPFYFLSSGAIMHREIYLAPYLPDFRRSPGSRTHALSKPTSGEGSLRSRFVTNRVTTQSWLWWVFLLFISYGAFHLSAWNAYFPTIIERWMWRGSGLIIAGTPVILLLVSPLSHASISHRIRRFSGIRDWLQYFGIVFWAFSRRGLQSNPDGNHICKQNIFPGRGIHQSEAAGTTDIRHGTVDAVLAAWVTYF